MGGVGSVTTYISFQPQPNTSPPFQAPVTLDAGTYSLTCWWSILGRWYYTITDQSGNVIVTASLVGSPDDAAIFLAPGIFQTSTILYRASTGNFEIVP